MFSFWDFHFSNASVNCKNQFYFHAYSLQSYWCYWWDHMVAADNFTFSRVRLLTIAGRSDKDWTRGFPSVPTWSALSPLISPLSHILTRALEWSTQGPRLMILPKPTLVGNYVHTSFLVDWSIKETSHFLALMDSYGVFFSVRSDRP